MKIDPVKREIINNALVTIADNMVVSVIRTSRSTVVKNNLDFSASICDAEGLMVAQGLALPVHLGATMPALKGCLDYFKGEIAPGDILASNDPYAGGSHLNDLFMFKPVFADGKPILILSLILHHTDMGGRVAGGNAADSTEIYQEGLRIPPIKLYDRGAPNETLFRIIGNNVRVPDRVLGDMRSQVAALDLAEKEVHKLLTKYDAGEFRAYMADLIDYAERLTRASIAKLPDGEVEFTEWNDDDGVGSGPVKIHCKLTVAGDEVTVDFAGTSPQTSGALNPNFYFTASCAYAALRTVLDRSMPSNAGFYRPIKVTAPEGCFVNPVFPAPFGARGQAGYRVRTVVLGALAKLLPERMPACPGGSEFAIVIAGYDRKAQDAAPFLLLEFHNMTGNGGSLRADGQDAGPYALGNVANLPAEVLEAESPVMLEEYGFLPDTGGAGAQRGALGIARQYRLLADEAMLQVRSDRQKFAPWGLRGGSTGAPGRTFYAEPGTPLAAVDSKFIRQMRRGDIFRVEMPGSGGYGDPLTRDPHRVGEDVRQGKMSEKHARDVYGVVVDANGIANEDATAALRATMRRTAQSAP